MTFVADSRQNSAYGVRVVTGRTLLVNRYIFCGVNAEAFPTVYGCEGCFHLL